MTEKDSPDTDLLSIPCPQCGQQVQKSLRWIKNNNQITCAGCGVAFALDPQPLLTGIKAANKALKQLLPRGGKIGR